MSLVQRFSVQAEASVVTWCKAQVKGVEGGGFICCKGDELATDVLPLYHQLNPVGKQNFSTREVSLLC